MYMYIVYVRVCFALVSRSFIRVHRHDDCDRTPDCARPDVARRPTAGLRSASSTWEGRASWLLSLRRAVTLSRVPRNPIERAFEVRRCFSSFFSFIVVILNLEYYQTVSHRYRLYLFTRMSTKILYHYTIAHATQIYIRIILTLWLIF